MDFKTGFAVEQQLKFNWTISFTNSKRHLQNWNDCFESLFVQQNNIFDFTQYVGKHTFSWCSAWCKYKVWIWCLLEPIPTVQVQRRCIPIVIVQRWISLSIRTMAILRTSIVQIVFQIEDKINFVLDFCSVQFLLAAKFSVKVEQFT